MCVLFFLFVIIAELYSYEYIRKSWTVMIAIEKASETQKGTPQ